MNRNELCSCGSGKRYKHCHGRIEFSGPSSLHLQAAAAHQAGALRRAEALYRQAIDADPRDVDSRHMLGMVHFERRRYGEALESLWDAAERTGWNDEVLRQNLGLLLAKLLAPEADARQEALVEAYHARTREIAAAAVAAGTVSVVIPIRDRGAGAARAIASVDAQTYRDIELVVVEDDAPAARAANLGVQRARGRHVAFLDADDWFEPGRIEAMVAAIARASKLWGFSRVRYAQDEGHAGLSPRDFLAHEPPSFTLLARNVIERSGNLFVDRDFFVEVGGFREDAQDGGWEFCVRAATSLEPVVVAQPLYVHGGRAPANAAASNPFSATADPRAPRLLAQALSGDATATNPFCPQFPANRILLLRSELRAGRGDRLPVALLRDIAADFRARPRKAGAPRARPTDAGERVALVVLGMYRSGTSAFARTLNLCGAVLPERMVAARLGINRKGFWEAEAVTDLDARMLEHLGGDWDRVGFALPTGGALIDEFLLNAREVIETEYADAPLILLKDPRICVLAPLWHRALQQGGYRPAYVVVVRHPLEVAGSLQTQGDMPLARGLALWLDYMARVESFADSVASSAIHVRYADLLSGWREVVGRIALRLRVPLDAHTRAQDVDRFLEADMRTHHARDAELDAAAGAQADAVRALYRRLAARCDADRDRSQGVGGT
jgi:hypothetical protein